MQYTHHTDHLFELYIESIDSEMNQENMTLLAEMFPNERIYSSLFKQEAPHQGIASVIQDRIASFSRQAADNRHLLSLYQLFQKYNYLKLKSLPDKW